MLNVYNQINEKLRTYNSIHCKKEIFQNHNKLFLQCTYRTKCENYPNFHKLSNVSLCLGLSKTTLNTHVVEKEMCWKIRHRKHSYLYQGTFCSAVFP